MIKRCTKCNQEKLATAENFDSFKTPSGERRQMGHCRECRNADIRAYRAERTEKVKEWSKRDRERNKDQKREANKKLWAKLTASERSARSAHQKEWRLSNPDKAKAHSKRDYEKHKHKRAARVTKWVKENPQARAAHTNRNRAKRLGVTGDYTKRDVSNMLKRYGRFCFYCSSPLTKFHVDHFIPLARGGSNDPENLRLSCSSCNSRKWAKMPWEWMPDRFEKPICEAA